MSSEALAHVRLLVAEDNPDFLAVVQSVLEEEGCTITPATSLPASLALLREQVFH